MANVTTQQDPHFDQMAQGLKGALQDFHPQETNNFLMSTLQPLGRYGLEAWNFTSGFVRRHPVQTTLGVLALGYLLSTRMTSSAPRSADGRQY